MVLRKQRRVSSIPRQRYDIPLPPGETLAMLMTTTKIRREMRIRSLTTLLWICFASTTVECSRNVRSLYRHRNVVVNGDVVTSLRDYQFFVRSWPDSVLQTPDLLCGASLIHSDMILTAAHCHGAFNYGAMLFNPFLDSLSWYQTVDKQVVHPDYYNNLEVINNDIMVMRLSEPVPDIVPVRLNNDPDFPVPGRDIAEATGVGVTDYEKGTVSTDLQVGYVAPISNLECSQRGNFVNVAISSDVMCVDPVSDDSVCSGDSGGPLTVSLVTALEQQNSPGGDVENGDLVTAIQVGVISFGTDCQADDVPDGMARVSYFYDWIQEQICRHSRSPPSDCPSLSNGTSSGDGFTLEEAVTVQLDFHHDFFAEQTTFSIRSLLTNKVVYVGPEYVPRRGESVTSTFQLSPGPYVFELYDTGGDGLSNPSYIRDTYPSGKWTLSVVYSSGGRLELVSGDENFEYLQSTQFEIPESQPPSEDLLTDSPSASPTLASTTLTPTTGLSSTPTLEPESLEPSDGPIEDGSSANTDATDNSASFGGDEGMADSSPAATKEWIVFWALLPVLSFLFHHLNGIEIFDLFSTCPSKTI
jgi:secreted trypsin-like serine protease